MIISFLGTIVTVIAWWLLADAQSTITILGINLSMGWRVGGGLVFLFDGLITLIWSVGVLSNAQREGRLALTGPFAYVRHPVYGALLYSGTACAAFAWSSWLVLLGVAPLTIMWTLIANSEESGLIQTFGDEYRTYQSVTGQLFPSFRKILSSGSGRQGSPS